MTNVHRLDATAVPQVVDVLHEAFFDYPVMRFVLGEDSVGYTESLRTLVNLFVMARVFRHETLLGIRSDETLIGTALVSRPGGPGAPPEFHELRERVWAELGEEAERRYAAFIEACDRFQVDGPHLHLNMIGVRREGQGAGLGRRLLNAVHEMSRVDPDSTGVTLTTEDPANVSLYRHFGYELVGEAVVGPKLTTWGFYRRDPT